MHQAKSSGTCVVHKCTLEVEIVISLRSQMTCLLVTITINITLLVGPRPTAAAQGGSSDSSSNGGIIAGGVIGALVVIVLVVMMVFLLIFLIYRYKTGG